MNKPSGAGKEHRRSHSVVFLPLLQLDRVFVTLLDAHRQWFKAKPNRAHLSETSREDAFCNYTIMHEEIFVVPGAQADRTFARNRYVVGEPHIRFYAGAPLTIR